MDFEQPPELDRCSQRSLLRKFNILPEDTVLLQPTRVVQRKGIEHAVDLVRALKRPNSKLVVSHAAGDEGMTYANWLKRYAEQSGVKLRFMQIQPSSPNGNRHNFARHYQQLWALYDRCDFVTFPSRSEGFGNAFIEAVYFKKPLLVNRYETFVRDIEPLGFDVVTMDGILDDHQIGEVNHLLACPERQAEMTRRNFEIARRHFSYRQVDYPLKAILEKLAATTKPATAARPLRHRCKVVALGPPGAKSVAPSPCNRRYARDRP